MASRKPADRNLRLAAALKQNLKRRKAGSERARAESVEHGSPAGVGPGAGTAPQGGLQPPAGPKTASKRN